MSSSHTVNSIAGASAARDRSICLNSRGLPVPQPKRGRTIAFRYGTALLLVATALLASLGMVNETRNADAVEQVADNRCGGCR